MKLPNGYGSVYKLSGKRRNPWVVRKTVGWTINSETRKSFPVYQFVGYFQNRNEALQALAEFNKDPYDLHDDKITFGELYDRWSEEHFSEVSKSNCNGYKAAYKTCAALKDMNIHDIKLDHLQKIVDESGKNRPTLRKLKTLLQLVYDYAAKHEIIGSQKRDILKYINISKAGNPNSIDRKPFTKKEIQNIWNMKDSNDYMSVILILIYTGVRISELLNLKKQDVHLYDQWFYIRESKTPSGIRDVPISNKVLQFFQFWMTKNKSEYFISTPDGKHFTYRNYYDSYWISMLDLLHEDHKPHDTRHTCISLLTEAGVDERIIKQIVGHKGQGVTECVYTHLDLQIKLDAINKI